MPLETFLWFYNSLVFLTDLDQIEKNQKLKKVFLFKPFLKKKETDYFTRLI